MFFYASKLIWFVLRPSNLAFFLICAGLFAIWRQRGWQGAGLILCVGGALLLGVAGYSPAANVMLAQLEHRFPPKAPTELSGDIDGIIILGGFEDFGSGTDHTGLPINEAAERLTEGVRLALQYPKAKVLFTGAIVSGLDTSQSLAGPVGRFLNDLGVDENRIILEPKARNTHENAVFAKSLVKPQPSDRWVLITSGYHMPRSVGVFRKAGFAVIPYPVDLRTRSAGTTPRGFASLSDGLKRFDMVVREYIGLVGYWLTGKTSNLFPGPTASNRTLRVTAVMARRGPLARAGGF